MKRIFIFTLAVVAVLSLTACSSYGSYNDGYAEGYADGVYDGYIQGEDYDTWYEAGYSDGRMDGSVLEEKAIRYAREYSEWSPEEAMDVIDAYQNNQPFWQDGSSPTHEDYMEAIESLYRFYEYFYCAVYNK